MRHIFSKKIQTLLDHILYSCNDNKFGRIIIKNEFEIKDLSDPYLVVDCKVPPTNIILILP